MCRLQDYQTDSLKAYFEQDGLLLPIETIKGKFAITLSNVTATEVQPNQAIQTC